MELFRRDIVVVHIGTLISQPTLHLLLQVGYVLVLFI